MWLRNESRKCISWLYSVGYTENLQWNKLSDHLFDTFANSRILDQESNPIESLNSGQFNGLGNLFILRLNQLQIDIVSLDLNIKNLRNFSLVSTVSPP